MSGDEDAFRRIEAQTSAQKIAGLQRARLPPFLHMSASRRPFGSGILHHVFFFALFLHREQLVFAIFDDGERCIGFDFVIVADL